MKYGFIEITEEEFQHTYNSTFLLLNFPENRSIKVYPYYNKLKKIEKDKIKNEIVDIIGYADINLEISGEAIENFLIVSYCLLKQNSVIAVNTAGLSFESIDVYKNIMKKVVDYFGNKSLYLVNCSDSK